MQTVIGLFENAHEAQKAVQKLMSNGFSAENVDVSVRGNDTSSGSYTSGTSDALGDDTLSGTSGSTSGSMYGSSTALGTSNASGGSLTSGDYSTGSSSYSDSKNDDTFGDKVSRFFKNLFGNDDDEASRYTHVANKTGSLVTVHAQSEEEAQRASDILDDNGAINVNERAAEYGYSGTTGTSSTNVGTSDYSGVNTGSSSATNLGTDADETNTLNVIREDIQVGKREVETGGVRLRSRIVERPVEEQLRLREERVTVERNPVDRAATTADFQNFKEGEIEMTERAEVPVVSKEARVVEEIKLSKDVTERTETINETARDTEVDVENLSKGNVTGKTNKKKNL